MTPNPENHIYGFPEICIVGGLSQKLYNDFDEISWVDRRSIRVYYVKRSVIVFVIFRL